MALDDVAATAKFAFGELTIEVAPANILEALRRLKHELEFERLSTVTGVDRYPAEPRFEIVYHLQSIARKTATAAESALPGENPEIESRSRCIVRPTGTSARRSICSASVSCNHPDLTRIMMPDDWEGHPLRKDYPVTGTRY